MPAVKSERIEATSKHQKEIEHEFEKREPELYREAADREPDGNWAIKGPMVAPLERGIAKMQEAGKGAGMGKPGPDSADYKRAADKVSMSEYDFLDSEDEHLSHDAMPKKGAGSAPPKSTPDAAAPEKKGRSGLGPGRGFFNKIMRSARPDTPS
ncbi:hypothetical protein PC116_g33777 [Phytophthora cactorum]|nr:hypothetical protein PC116_g33777 [Phytophthora cactorum]